MAAVGQSLMMYTRRPVIFNTVVSGDGTCMMGQSVLGVWEFPKQEGLADTVGGCYAIRGSLIGWRNRLTGASWSSTNTGKCQVTHLGENNLPQQH